MSDYIEILKQHLKHKMDKNPKYSMRALARDLELSPGLISGLLTQKITVSLKTAKIIARKLNLDERSSYLFLSSIQSTHNKHERKRSNLIKHEIIIDQQNFEDFEAELSHILQRYDLKNIETNSVRVRLILAVEKSINP